MPLSSFGRICILLKEMFLRIKYGTLHSAATAHFQ